VEKELRQKKKPGRNYAPHCAPGKAGQYCSGCAGQWS